MPSQQVTQLLDKHEKIVLIGTYNINYFSFNPLIVNTNNINSTSSYGYADLKLNNRRLLNSYSNLYNIASTGTSISLPNTSSTPIMLAEEYILNTYNQEKTSSLGQLSWSSNYITSTPSYISTGVHEFMVSGSSGIYSTITKIIIDFTSPDRAVYFVEKKLESTSTTKC